MKLVCEEYKRNGYGRDAICKMVGLKKSALAERLNEAK